jgi:hypothetical protein
VLIGGAMPVGYATSALLNLRALIGAAGKPAVTPEAASLAPAPVVASEERP